MVVKPTRKSRPYNHTEQSFLRIFSTMPLHPSASDTRLKNILDTFTPILTLLNQINDAFGTPLVTMILSTISSLITAVQSVKRNKTQCLQLMDKIHGLLYAIANLHLRSDTPGSLTPAILQHIAKFTETLHKIHTFVELQQDGRTFKNLFRQVEISSLRNECQTRLEDTLNSFNIDMTSLVFSNMDVMREKTECMHKELLELISTVSEGTGSDMSSSIYQNFDDSTTSLNSLAMLPGRPKIFHGREMELQTMTEILGKKSPRIAILGGGGMGKTSLARMIIHDTRISARYGLKIFVAVDSATTGTELAAQIGVHIGLKQGKDLRPQVLDFFVKQPSCLLVLDNLETSWEPIETRDEVEDFLGRLTDISNVALIITMRGAERPAKVQWSHPFLPPLGQLSYDAALQTFFDIADDFHDRSHVNQLLHLTDNMPLAIDLIAHLVDYEGCSNILDRWATEKTTLLSEGHDKRSNLDASITISLLSPQMKSVPGAMDLLSLLSILPDGLSDVELIQSNLPITNVMTCKATLLRTSLAYLDSNRRVKSLLPIREHIQHFHPPSQSLIHSLQSHFQSLLNLYKNFHGSLQITAALNQISANHGNLYQMLLRGLNPDNPYLSDATQCTVLFNHLCRLTNHGFIGLMDHIPALLHLVSCSLEALFITELFNSYLYRPIANPELLVHQAVLHFQNLNEPSLEYNFYVAVGGYYCYCRNDISMGLQYWEKGLALSQLIDDTSKTSSLLTDISMLKLSGGHYLAAQEHANEAQRLAKVSGNLYVEAKALWCESCCCIQIGDYRHAAFLMSRAINLPKLCGMSGGILDHRLLNAQAQLHLLKSEYREAHNLYTQILENTPTEKGSHEHAFCLLNIAEIEVIIGATASHVSCGLDKAKQIFASLGMSTQVTFTQTIWADLALRDGDKVTAKTIFVDCLNSTWGKNSQAVTYCLERLADVCRWGPPNFGWSSTCTIIYLVYAQKSKEKLTLHKALQFLADVFLSNGDDFTAKNLLTVALDGFTHMDVHHSRARCMAGLADLSWKHGDAEKASELWTAARPLFERSLQRENIAQVDKRLALIQQAHIA